MTSTYSLITTQHAAIFGMRKTSKQAYNVVRGVNLTSILTNFYCAKIQSKISEETFLQFRKHISICTTIHFDSTLLSRCAQTESVVVNAWLNTLFIGRWRHTQHRVKLPSNYSVVKAEYVKTAANEQWYSILTVVLNIYSCWPILSRVTSPLNRDRILVTPPEYNNWQIYRMIGANLK